MSNLGARELTQELCNALDSVIAVSDRKTDIYDAAKAVLARARSTGAYAPPSDLAERVGAARMAVAQARLSIARLLDRAVSRGLSDQSPLVQEAFASIARLDEAFPSDTDVGTGQPLPSRDRKESSQ